MGCNNCNNKTGNIPKGCKNNGNCQTGSCDKFSVFDWLSNMNLPGDQKPYDWVEIRFKNGRKSFFKNLYNLSICVGDIVTVEGVGGYDIGTVSLTGELVKIQMRNKIGENTEMKKIIRKSLQTDIDNWEKYKRKEKEVQKKSKEISIKMGLEMKFSDVEYQADGKKATFYYTSESRVDFRQLVKELARIFQIRVEMKQINARQETALLGGIGSCGRELCCSSWFTSFRKVTSSAARYQRLSLNPVKLAGQCGKLKCCLNFELDTYLDALNKFPRTDIVLETKAGVAKFVKMDIFKELLWYALEDEKFEYYQLTLEQVLEIIDTNKKGKKIETLEHFSAENGYTPTKIDFENVVGQDSLTRFDTVEKSHKRKKFRRSKPKENV